MNKTKDFTVKDLVDFLQNCAGSETFSYENLLGEINKKGWSKYLLFEEKIFDSHPRMVFMGLFKKRKGKKILVQVFTKFIDNENGYNCYLLIGKRIYKVAIPGGKTISLGE